MAQEADCKSQDPGRNWHFARLFALLIVPLIGWFSLLEPFGRDQGIHATIAYALDGGLITYRDVFNMKPPLTTGIHWMSQTIFGHSMVSIRALDLVFTALTSLGILEVGRRLDRGLIFGYAAPFGFWNRAQTDGWAGFLIVAALLCMILGWEHKKGAARFALIFCGGLAVGLAFGVKYTIGATGMLVFAPALARLIGKTEFRFFLSDFVATFVGGITAVLAVVLALALGGALAPFLEIQEFIRGYVGFGKSRHPGLIHELSLIHMPSKYLLTIVLAGLCILFLRLFRQQKSMLLSVALIWLFSGWLSGFVQGKGFGYHYLPILPVYAILFGVCIESTAGLVRDPRRRGFIVALVLMCLFVPSRAALFDKVSVQLMFKPEPAMSMRELIPETYDYDIVATVDFFKVMKQHRVSGDSLFLWGYSTMLYFLVQEPPRYRYPYTWPFMLAYYDGRYNGDLLNRLKDNPPKHFVVQARDATPLVTHNIKSSDDMLPEYPEIEQFLKENYHSVEKRPRFTLYELNES